MTEKDNILSKWLQGEVSDQEVKSLFPDIDLELLKSTLATQEKLEITSSDPNTQWDILESKLNNKKPLESEKPSSNKSSSSSSYLKWLILGLFLVAGGFLIYFSLSNSKTVIKPKDFREYAFEDNSKARIWPGSKLTFYEPNYLNDRSMQLEGEAFFNVEKGTPFTVKTAAGQIQVLGTSFNIWAPDHKNTEVKCYSGSVRVTDNYNKQVVLTTGQSVKIVENKLVEMKPFSVDKHKLKGALKHYDNAKIQWVLDDLKQLYNIEIKINNNLKDQRFTGSISVVELNQALNYLCKSMKWVYDQENQVININEEN